MKIKNIFLLILIAVSMQNASAAVMTIYNDTGGNVDLTARWESKSEPLGVYQNFKLGAAKGSKLRIDNRGTYRFINLMWKASNDVLTYYVRIPSSPMMLMGKITLHAGGKYTINFDENGASDKKIRTLQG